VIIGNNIASLKKIKASEEALRAPKKRNSTLRFFLNVPHHYNIMTKNAIMIFVNVCVALGGVPRNKNKGTQKWNIQTQA
jgi:hypothetical protein